MLTGFTWCIPIKSKKATDVARAYLQHVYSVLGGSTKILTDNGTEFKNEVFKEALQKLGTEKLIHSPPYRPQSNGSANCFLPVWFVVCWFSYFVRSVCLFWGMVVRGCARRDLY